MVRTKISRNNAAKRNRNSQLEERYLNAMRELEILSDTIAISIEEKYNADMEKLNRSFSMIRTRIPKEVLQMTVGELRRSDCKQFFDVLNMNEFHMGEPNNEGSSANVSQESCDPPSHKSCRSDEGYQTEDCNGLLASAKALRPIRPMGPLASAMKAKKPTQRRRSNSISGQAITPSKKQSQTQAALVFGMKAKQTPAVCKSIFAQPHERLSRLKMRTPMQETTKRARGQAVSTDRGISQITLKVNLNTPITFLRHPRVGESVFSQSGSPVVNATAYRQTRHINIPVPNGMLALQSDELHDEMVPEMMPHLDSDTMDYLKGLKNNLDKLMRYAEDCNFHMNE
ncbi:borealin-like [Anopheles darlingi]|uniref:borealin-like n=1 Tax=Anopheles darlingi TaxID=43151 RepID=UPI0021001C67|nr:borealin-like [Anopheles darlingi]